MKVEIFKLTTEVDGVVLEGEARIHVIPMPSYCRMMLRVIMTKPYECEKIRVTEYCPSSLSDYARDLLVEKYKEIRQRAEKLASMELENLERQIHSERKDNIHLAAKVTRLVRKAARYAAVERPNFRGGCKALYMQGGYADSGVNPDDERPECRGRRYEVSQIAKPLRDELKRAMAKLNERLARERETLKFIRLLKTERIEVMK